MMLKTPCGESRKVRLITIGILNSGYQVLPRKVRTFTEVSVRMSGKNLVKYFTQ